MATHYLADANVIFTGDLFVNNNRYPMIDFGNGGPRTAAASPVPSA